MMKTPRTWSTGELTEPVPGLMHGELCGQPLPQHTAVPTCYGRPMSPEDVCHPRAAHAYGEGMPEPHDSTYRQQLDSLTSGGWTAVVIGVVLLALAVVIGVARAASTAQDGRK